MPANATPALRAWPGVLLRGISQVMLVEQPLTGLLFLIGVGWNSPLLGAGLLLGTVTSTLTALLLGAERGAIRAGLYGFNGALVGIALLIFLQPGPLTWSWLVLAAATSSVLMAALTRLLERNGVPALTAPFVFATFLFVLAAGRFGRLEPSGLLPAASLPASASVEGVVDLVTLGQGLLNGIGQVFFQQNLVSGALFALGLLLASRRAFAAALGGSALGALLAWGMGAPETAIRAGVFGFNPVLTAIALYGVLLLPGRHALAYAVLGAGISAVAFAALSAGLEPFGLPALTLPFVLVTWVFVAAAAGFGRLHRTGAD